MIEHYVFDGRKKNRFSWAANLIPNVLQFNQDLTIVVGPNGSGKSTLLSLLAAGTLSERCGYPVLDTPTLDKEFEPFSNDFLLDGLSVIHDGQIFYASSTKTNWAGGDEGNFGNLMRGLVNHKMEHYSSSGESVLYRMMFAAQLMAHVIDPDNFVDLDSIVEKKVRRYKRVLSNEGIQQIWEEECERYEKMGKIPIPKIPVFEDHTQGLVYNETWNERKKIIVEYFDENRKIVKSKPTLLLDEPDAHLSFPMQRRLWQMLTNEKVLSSYQIIVTTHSIIPIFWLRQNRLSRENFVELKHGYLDELSHEISLLNEL